MKRFVSPSTIPSSSTKGDERDKLLFPKQHGLVRAEKPICIILNSPHDSTTDYATRYSDIEKTLLERGFAIANTGPISFNLNIKQFKADKTELVNHSKLAVLEKHSKSAVIWLEAHGSPGWIFGPGSTRSSEKADWPTIRSETKATINFYAYLMALQEKTGLNIKAVVLNGCYSGLEFVNDDKDKCLYSSARLLSSLLPNIPVLGFTGVNNSAKIMGLFEFDPSKLSGSIPTNLVLPDDALLQPATVSVSEASILFKNGDAIEYEKNRALFYTQNQYMHPFIGKLIDLNKDDASFFRVCPAKEKTAELRTGYLMPNSFSYEKILNFFDKKGQELNKPKTTPKP